MTITCAPEVEQREGEAPPNETRPLRRRGGWLDWFLKPRRRIGLNLGSDDELLLIENKTPISWTIYHNFHQLGIIDCGELLAFHVCKHGSLNVRPCDTTDTIEYLVLSLNYYVNQVYIYKRKIGKDVEIYDMRSV